MKTTPTHEESENILDSIPQIIYKYPTLGRKENRKPDPVNIIHINYCYGSYYISLKISSCGDCEWISNGYDSLEKATEVFLSKKYNQIVETYLNGNVLDLADSSIFEKYIPKNGACSTLEGEALRALFKLEYRFFNDGDMISSLKGNLDSIKAPYMFLKEYSQSYPANLNIEYVKELEVAIDKPHYEDLLMEIKISICKNIILNESNLTKNNGYDMYDYTYTKMANKYFNIID